MRRRSQSAQLTRSLLLALVISLVISALVLVGTALAGAARSDADLTYTDLDYQATVQPDGGLRVVQKVTMRLQERDNSDGDATPWRQLFQQYNKSQLKGPISDISVIGPDGQAFTQTRPLLPSQADQQGIDWDSQEAGKWYINQNANNGQAVEIGWNIPATDSADSLSFTVAMTFDQAVSRHPDVADIQWEPVATSNTIPIEHLSGTLSFPAGVDADTVHNWLHYEGPISTSHTTADGSFHFTASQVSPGSYVDTRSIFPAAAMTMPVTDNKPAKATILAEQAAKRAAWERGLQQAAIIRLVIWGLLTLLVVILSIFSLRAAVRTHKGSLYTGQLEYWRDLPAMSPAAAGKLLAVMEPHSGVDKDLLSATILSLASKQVIALLPGTSARYAPVDARLRDPDLSVATVPSLAAPFSSAFAGAGLAAAGTRPGRDRLAPDIQATTTIVLPAGLSLHQGEPEQTAATAHLSASELAALRILLLVQQLTGGRPYFSLDEVKPAVKANQSLARQLSESLASRFDAFKASCDKEFTDLQASRSSYLALGGPAALLAIAAVCSLGYFGLTGQLLLGGLLGGLGLFIACFSGFWGRIAVLTANGQTAAGQVRGLRDYLLDFSSFQERGVPDLALWDRYLVYAATFGISREAITQLGLAEPHLADQGWSDQNLMLYPLLWSFYRPFGFVGGFGTGSMPNVGGAGFTGWGNGFSVGDIGGQLSANLGSIQSTVSTAIGSVTNSGSGGGFGGGFGGGGGGVGGGSFGGR